ncbi:MAG: DUF488 domain-containing protein [Gemmatimonadaceae bacterium]|nr:DUF488 domain-containing protein [Gemmatimonadaceae bacterium]
MSTTVWTIGHSTRDRDAFLSVLRAFDIELVADVRRFPASRRLPQFNTTALAECLATEGIAYRWFPSLGGRRRSNAASRNLGWRHPAFRAYADHLESEEFAQGLFELTMLASELRTAVMCAEILWWRCHRRLVADVLVALGMTVVHIRTADVAERHHLAPPARLVRGRLAYDVEQDIEYGAGPTGDG